MTNKEILDVVHEVLKASQEADMGVDTVPNSKRAN